MIRILIVEDDPGLIEILSLCLEARGFSVTAASTIGEAMEIAAAMPPPDLVLLDLSVTDSPDPAGTIEKIPELASPNPELAAIPVVVMTAHTDKSLMEAATESGASAFVFKPDLAKEDLLFKTIEKVIESKGHYEAAQKSAEDLQKVEEKIKRLSNGGTK